MGFCYRRLLRQSPNVLTHATSPVKALCAFARARNLPKKDCSIKYGKVESLIFNMFFIFTGKIGRTPDIGRGRAPALRGVVAVGFEVR